jgi:GNAT superfamily N-acetyltransferase
MGTRRPRRGNRRGNQPAPGLPAPRRQGFHPAATPSRRRRMTPAIRPFRYGDMGPIVTAQANYYGAEHGWHGSMEKLLLEITGNFLGDHVPGRSNCWIAEYHDQVVGSVFCVDAGDDIAQLRLLYIDAAVRGLGLGSRLVAECVDFARAAGYRELMLWTHAVLLPARRLYAAAGFGITATATHDDFGRPEPGETWTLDLRA